MRIPDFTALGGPVQDKPSEAVSQLPDGGAPGAALERFGAVASSAGSNLQDILDTADVNNAMANMFQPKVNALAADYYSTQGKAAVDAAPQFTQSLQDTMDATASTLSGAAQRNFIKQAQTIVDNHEYKASVFAGEQARAYAASAQDAAIYSHLQDYSQNYMTDLNSANDSKILAGLSLGSYLGQIGIAEGSDLWKQKEAELDDRFNQAAATAKQSYFLSLTPAQQVQLSKSKGWPSASQDQSAPSSPAKATAANVADAILGQESNNDPNAPTSVDGAVGAQQITPGTFAQWAKPGQSIMNNADRQDVFTRMMADYSQRYNGDPQRIAVAYFSGPGNVAPAGSATPWINDVKDGNGKAVSSYVSDINQRLSPAPIAQSTNGAASQAADTSQPSSPPMMNGVPLTQEEASKFTEAAILNNERANKLQNLTSDANFQKTQQDFFSKTDPANPQLTWADIQASNLPVEGPGGKDWWTERLAKVTKEKMEKTDPAVFNDLMNRATMPDGTPNKLTDPKELISYVGHGITPADMGHIQSAMEGGDPGKEALKQFYKMGHDQLSTSSMTNIDGEGERRAYNWYMATSKAIADGQAAGKSISQLINPQSKDYVGNNINQFQESLTDQTNNLNAKLQQSTPTAPLPDDKKRKQGESIATWVSRLVSRGGFQ